MCINQMGCFVIGVRKHSTTETTLKRIVCWLHLLRDWLGNWLGNELLRRLRNEWLLLYLWLGRGLIRNERRECNECFSCSSFSWGYLVLFHLNLKNSVEGAINELRELRNLSTTNLF